MSKESTLRKACQELATLRDSFQHNQARFAELDKLVTELDKMANPARTPPRKIVSEIGNFERAVVAKTKSDSFDAQKAYARQLNSLFNAILKALN